MNIQRRSVAKVAGKSEKSADAFKCLSSADFPGFEALREIG
jgi:hypothetical protein